ncbi:hypothetical protein JYG23_13615 [Sedimentibacter sp. zth1]|uniref:hypothetical protein n=1 Tax=Sedimentibacter sp. zth1 TaxID=2816908 RepID=UPI001A92E5F0|nr:hypothetical protein [Sedimentibacter sp. zth1]QSX05684.1 hypothetical protein JYG23_13615 [Sedimentibacter sp. zth1]
MIPDFVGYIYLIKGLDEMINESELFNKPRPFAVGMCIYTSIMYVGSLFGIVAHLGWIGVILAIVSTIISLYISYIVVSGVRDIETKRNAELNGEKLQSTWNSMAIFQIATYISLLIPVLGVICVIVSFIIAIVFLVAFNTNKNLYEGLPPCNDFKLD